MTYQFRSMYGSRDKNEPEVVAYLRAHGFLVWPIRGRGVPDLLVWHGQGRRFVLLEVKNPNTHSRGKGKKLMTEQQERLARVWESEKAPVFTVTSGEEAVRKIREWDVGQRFDCTDVEGEAV